ncbi:sulfotransferase family protein [Haliea sp. E17]|uniref:sulfotransferase family protein n=1 Tax=Haliea sp. E17 TaxID=3401576 RepID=UPI003AAD4491
MQTAATVKINYFFRRFRAFLGKGWVVHKREIVVSNVDERSPSPIFIIGTHRSGTSLLRRIIDSHPAIACPPESFFMSHYFSLISDDEASIGFDNLSISHDSVRQVLASQSSYFHEAYRKAKGKSRWADKTPQYFEYLNEIDQLFAPDVVFVNIIRNPLDVAYSIWSRKWDVVRKDGDYLDNVCKYVARAGLKQLAFFDQTSSRYVKLRYEDLVENTRVELERVIEVIGEPWCDEIMNFSRIPHDFGTEDPIVRGTKRIQGSTGNWRAWKQSQLNCAVKNLKDLMIATGYAIPE